MYKKQKKAFALSIVLWIVIALLFGATTIAILSKDTLYLTKGVDDKLASQMTAQDILELIKFYVLTADYDSTSFKNINVDKLNYAFPKKIVLDNRWYDINDEIKIRFQDTSSLVNVFLPQSQYIANLATSLAERTERFIIEDSILDWIDEDDKVRLNGAEKFTYLLKNKSEFKPRNSPAIQSIHELKLINGISKLSNADWLKLQKRLYYGRGSMKNLMLIDKKFLSLLLKINKDKASSYTDLRAKDEDKFKKLVLNENAYYDEEMGFFISRELIIEIVVTKNIAQSRLKTIIDFKPRKYQLYSTSYYSLN